MLTEKIGQLGSAVTSSLAGVNFSTPTWDLFIILFFVIAVFLYGISLGRDRNIIMLMGIYMALAIANSSIFQLLEDKVGASGLGKIMVLKTILFLGTFVVLFFLLTRSSVLRSIGMQMSGPWWHAFLFSVLQVGLLVSVTLSFLPKNVVDSLAPITKLIFTSDIGRFAWIVAPIAAMIILPEQLMRRGRPPGPSLN